MADADIAITAGSGTKIDTRTVGAGTDEHRQVIVVGDPNTAANVADVTTQGLATVVRRDTQRLAVNSAGLTIASTAYAAGDQLGTQLTFTNAARLSGGTGTIVGCTITDAADIVGAIDLAIFRTSVTLAADNASFAISDSDALSMVAIIQLGNVTDIGNNRFLQATNIAIPYDCFGGTSLFGALITRTGHTFFGAVTDLQSVLYVERN